MRKSGGDFAKEADYGRAHPTMLRQFTLRQIKRGIAIAALALVGGGFSAHAALIVLKAAAKPAAPAPAAPAGFESQDHFPGAALLYPAEEMAAPAAGATGTTALPDVPIPEGAEALSTEGTVTPARAFSMAGASPTAKARALQCLATAIYYEAASESEEGQRAVAQVILNRVRHPAFPASVCGVIYQGSERSTGCQFSYACDGSMARAPSREGMARATRYAAQALAGYVVPAVGTATHYHTYAVTPSWNRTLVMTRVIGAHLFHRWKGYWGTPGAFAQRYSGAEPLPGPKPKSATAQIAAAAAPVLPVDRTPAPFAKAAYADSGLPHANMPVATAANALPESTILDKWQGTGQPLR